MQLREEQFNTFQEERIERSSVKDFYPEATIEKKIEELHIGEKIFFGHYLEVFTVIQVKSTGFPLAVLKNERTTLTLRGGMRVRSTEIKSGKRKK